MDLIEYRPHANDERRSYCGCGETCNAFRGVSGQPVCTSQVRHGLTNGKALLVNPREVAEAAAQDDASPALVKVAEALSSHAQDALRRAIAGLSEEPWKAKVQTR